MFSKSLESMVKKTQYKFDLLKGWTPLCICCFQLKQGKEKRRKKGKILRKSVKEQCSREKRKENIQSIVSRPPMSLVWFGSEFCGQSSVWKSLYSRIPSHLWRNIRWVMWFHSQVCSKKSKMNFMKILS